MADSRPSGAGSWSKGSQSSSLKRRCSNPVPDDQTVDDHQDAEGLNVTSDAAPTQETETQKTAGPADSDSDNTAGVEYLEKDDAGSQIGKPGSTVEETDGGVPYEHDIEADAPALSEKKSSRSIADRNLVTWDSPNDPANPKNWSIRRKWAATMLVSCFTLVSPVSSSMIAPALPSISQEFHITAAFEAQLTLSIFVLAYAIGPLILGPLSEIYGRVIVLQLANLFYLAWNLGCGFAQNKAQLMAFRFLSGLGGSAPMAVGGGVLSDCFPPEQRGKALSIYTLAPLLGPAIGPIAGGFIAQNTTWRWCFWATSIFTALVQCFGVFFLQETYAPKLLARKRDMLRKQTGNLELHTEYDDPNKTLGSTLKTALQRPFRLLGTQPIVQVLAIYVAFLYGIMYLMLGSFPTLWTEQYHQSTSTGSLNFLSMGLGFFLGTQICAPLNDAIYRRLKTRNAGVGKPEFRVPMMVPASLLAPTGLFWYGWSAQMHAHWIMPNVGATIFCAGTIVGFQCVQTYIVDAYARYAASALAAATVLRSLAGFGFPLFAPALYRGLEWGWGSSALAFVAVGLGVPAPALLWWFGGWLRGRSRYAAGG